MCRGLVLSTLHPDSTYEARRIVEEARLRGWSVDDRCYEKICFHFDEEGQWAEYDGSRWSLNGYDWCYSRPTHYRDYGGSADLKTMLIDELMQRGTHVVNGGSLLKWQHFSKKIQYHLFRKGHLPVIRSWCVGGVVPSYLYHFPMVVKEGVSSMGQGVFFVKSRAELEELLKGKKIGNFLFQEYIPIQEDYRIMVIGGQAVGVIKRLRAENSFLTNISAGGEAEIVDLSEPMKQLAEQVIGVCELDHGGVDLLLDTKGELRILEVNRHPQFSGFERVTGMNIAGMILDSV